MREKIKVKVISILQVINVKRVLLFLLPQFITKRIYGWVYDYNLEQAVIEYEEKNKDILNKVMERRVATERNLIAAMTKSFKERMEEKMKEEQEQLIADTKKAQQK